MPPVLAHSRPLAPSGETACSKLSTPAGRSATLGSERRLLPAAVVCSARAPGPHQLRATRPIPCVPEHPAPACPHTPGPASSQPTRDSRPGCPPFQKPLVAPSTVNFFLSSTDLPAKTVLRGSEARPEKSRGNAAGASRAGGEEGDDFKVKLKSAFKLLGCSRNTGPPEGSSQRPCPPPRSAPQSAQGLPSAGNRTDAPPSLPDPVGMGRRRRPRLNPSAN